MRVLVGCEYSGKVREAFRKLGHDAWSCDLLPADDCQNYHIQGDVVDAILSRTWDLIILHPPCTHLCVSGNRHYGKGTPGYSKRVDSAKWTEYLWGLAVFTGAKVALENPVGVINSMTDLPSPQYIQPWQFGHGETKKTGLWLQNLPPLMPTNVVNGRDDRIHKIPPSKDRWKIRSETYQGIADAMADQWGKL